MGKKEGKLYLNENGRLALDRYNEFHCGDVVEVKLDEEGEWVTVRIEMDTYGDWYLTGGVECSFRITNIVGLTARMVR